MQPTKGISQPLPALRRAQIGLAADRRLPADRQVAEAVRGPFGCTPATHQARIQKKRISGSIPDRRMVLVAKSLTAKFNPEHISLRLPQKRVQPSSHEDTPAQIVTMGVNWFL